MSMTVGELRDALEGLDDSVQVRLANQPRWAFEYSVALVTEPVTIKDDDCGEVECVYLAEGNQIGYLPHRAAVACGWSDAGEDDEDDEAGV